MKKCTSKCRSKEDFPSHLRLRLLLYVRSANYKDDDRTKESWANAPNRSRISTGRACGGSRVRAFAEIQGPLGRWFEGWTNDTNSVARWEELCTPRWSEFYCMIAHSLDHGHSSTSGPGLPKGLSYGGSGVVGGLGGRIQAAQHP